MARVSGEDLVVAAPVARPAYARHRRYLLFVLPALLLILVVIAFPWAFTLWMSLNEWQVASAREFVGFQNYLDLARDSRFLQSIGRTFYFIALAVVLPVVFGTLAALIFHQEFPWRGFFRGVFILPMMATPAAVALIWTMMFHPQQGVLNYVLSVVGLPKSLWAFAPDTVIPSLVLVEVWHWTPLVMLIVLGGLAAIPTDPYESALIDGANAWQTLRHITLPLVMPFVMVAVVLRTIDALKAFDTIYVITQGGPGTASETINIFLYLQAFAFYKIGYASAVVVVFFLIIVLLSMLLLYARRRTVWA